MNAETFTERKNLLEEFYKERMKFKISKIDIFSKLTKTLTYMKIWVIYFLKHILHLQKTGF